jgi:4-oxalocrotonate tautomerase
MPLIHVQMLRGRSPEQKRVLIAELTRVLVDVAGATADAVNVLIEEVEAENWGRGGTPLTAELAPSAGGSRVDAR